MEEKKALQEDEMQQVTGGTSMEYLALTSFIISIDSNVSETIKDPPNQDYTLYWILSNNPEITEVSFAKDGANTAVDANGNTLTNNELLAFLKQKYKV